MPGVSALLAAVGFLTRIPVRGGDPARGAALFPIVGAGIGATVGGTAFGLARVMPTLPAAGVALAVGALLTGALHLDGLADTADAFGTRTRERGLEVMRDHATGAYGVTAVVLNLIVKVSALAALATHARVVVDALAAGALSRAVPVMLAATLPPARTDGAGAAFRVGSVAVVIAAAIAAGVAIAASGWLILAAAGVALVVGAWSWRRLGGVTGDTLGAATELAETAALVVAATL
jgi:cobalamin 5'-phosphate synthase/cobalamin synthase